jgi:hypothetical protein
MPPMGCRRKGTSLGHPPPMHPLPGRLRVWRRQFTGGAEVTTLTFGGGWSTGFDLVRLGRRHRSSPAGRARHVSR